MFTSFVYFMIANNIILFFIRKTNKGSSKLNWLLILIHALVLGVDIHNTYQQENYFKYFRIQREYDQTHLAKNFKRLKVENHPDKHENNNYEEYNKLQELYEIFGNPKNDGIIKSYRYFKSDVYNDYFNKFSSKGFSYYNYEYLDALNTNYYIVGFMQLFVLKEIVGRRNKPKIIFVVFLALCFCVECLTFGYYGFNQYTEDFLSHINQIEFLKDLTYSEIVDLIKRCVMALYFIVAIASLKLLPEPEKVRLNDILGALKNKLTNKNFDVTEENQALKSQIEKQEKKKTEDSRTMMILFVMLCFYFLIYIFGL